MYPLSPLSSPESLLLNSPHRPNFRRLTQDLPDEVTCTSDEKPPPDHFNSWTAFFKIFGQVPVRIDQEEFPDDPFNDLPSLPSSIPIVSPSSESFSSGSDSCGQGNGTNNIPLNFMTPLNYGRAAIGEVLLGQTLELGNCTYELDQDNLTSNISKLNTTSNIFPDTSFQKHDFSISSTPLNTFKTDLPSDPTTSDVRSNNRIPRKSVVNELFKSPIRLLTVKPADNTVDIENDNALGESASPTRRDSVKIPPAPKPPSKLIKSTIPVMSRLGNKPGNSSNRTLRGLRPASSANSLSQATTRPSLLPTSFKSRSHERINAPSDNRGFYFKK